MFNLSVSTEAQLRHVAWFHELDAWTEYWDIYHPETRGRFYFGDGVSELGLLTQFLPRGKPPSVFTAWTRMALGLTPADNFLKELRVSKVADAIKEVDDLVGRLFSAHFGDASSPSVQRDYLDAIFSFAMDTLPPATERDARIAVDDPRKPTAGRHTLDSDLMWFAWALQTEGAHAICGRDDQHARRALLLAGVAAGCSVNFAWRKHRRTRSEYRDDSQTLAFLHAKGINWASDFDAATKEIHALYRIREWGNEN